MKKTLDRVNWDLSGLDIDFAGCPHYVGRGIAGLGGLTRSQLILVAAVVADARKLEGSDYTKLVAGLDEGFRDYRVR